MKPSPLPAYVIPSLSNAMLITSCAPSFDPKVPFFAQILLSCSLSDA